MPRPVPSFGKFVGHKPKVDYLRRQADGAKERGEPCAPVLFIGPSGVGKTLLGRALATHFGSNMILANGQESAHDLLAKLGQLRSGDFFFVDEAQNLSAKAQDLLLCVIDGEPLPPCDDPHRSAATGSHAAANPMAIVRCTVVLATDRPGKLVNALQKRMEIKIRLGSYSLREMREIVSRQAKDMNLLISAQARNRIAKVAGGLPRSSQHLLNNLRRHFVAVEHQEISLPQVRQFLKAAGIDRNGLGQWERRYLRHLARVGKASLESLALRLGTDPDYVLRQVEPPLMRLCLISVGSSGRALTELGRKYLSRLNGETGRDAVKET